MIWPETVIPEREVENVAAFFKITEAEARRRLEAYRLEDFEGAWKKAGPKTDEQMHRFYAETDLYIWELTNWYSSGLFRVYRELLQQLSTLAPLPTHRRVLDYGSGIGSAAGIMAGRGYDVTIADVPGKTFEYAQFRLQREGYQFKTLPISPKCLPTLGTYDIILCFDVLEHIPNPENVVAALSASLRTGGYGAIVAVFYDPSGHHPHHLAENIKKFGDNSVWSRFLESQGLKRIKPYIHIRTNRFETFARSIRYKLWCRTGYLFRSPIVKQT